MKTQLIVKKCIKLFVILLITGAVSLLRAQSLQFSRVLLLSSEQTVPQGYIWKIESCLGVRTTSSGGSSMQTPPDSHLILINSVPISVATNGYGTIAADGSNSSYWYGSKTEVCTTMPIWLPEGTTVNISSNVNFISIVEFKIIP